LIVDTRGCDYAHENNPPRSERTRKGECPLHTCERKARRGIAALLLGRPQVPGLGPLQHAAMTRHAAHDAPSPFLLWHSRCQDASAMAAHCGVAHCAFGPERHVFRAARQWLYRLTLGRTYCAQ
ncbi:hypothetical protein CCMA1212_000866, partial [Trichoderma ghanense]